MITDCNVPACDKPRYNNQDICVAHYTRRRRTGSVQADRPLQDRGGSNVGYKAAHRRCSTLWGSASGHACCVCGSTADQWAYDHTDPEGKVETQANLGGDLVEVAYSPWPEFYKPMCKSCHLKQDVALSKRSVPSGR